MCLDVYGSHLSADEQELFRSLYGPDKIDAVIVAAGVGSRMQAKVPKQYLKLGEKTLLEHTVHKLLASPVVNHVVLVLSPEDGFFASTDLVGQKRLLRVDGGAERVDSVLNGLSAVTTPWALVHDCARPFVQHKDIEHLCQAVALATQSKEVEICGGILACPSVDTLKRKERGVSTEFCCIDTTIDRSLVYRAQTPQLFPTAFLRERIQSCLAQGLSLTDEASVMDYVEAKAILVEASALNFKITTPEDLMIAQALFEYHGGHTEF